MGLSAKLAGALTFWARPYERRRGVLASVQSFGWALVMIGIVFLALALGGVFPAPLHVMASTRVLAQVLAKLLLYVAAGGAAVAAAIHAQRALRVHAGAACSCAAPGGGTGGNGSCRLRAWKLLLAASLLCVLATVALTIASLARSAAAAPHAVAIIIAIVVLVVRLLFASVLTMAIWTLHEAERDPAVADLVAAGIHGGLPVAGVPATKLWGAGAAVAPEAPPAGVLPPPLTASGKPQLPVSVPLPLLPALGTPVSYPPQAPAAHPGCAAVPAGGSGPAVSASMLGAFLDRKLARREARWEQRQGRRFA